MKIVRQIREVYDERSSVYQRLKDEVDRALKPKVEEKGWFFISRVKEINSFALKLETGKVPDPACLEDFLGCTIVVPTLVHIDDAERLVCDIYPLFERRPASDRETSKDPSDFRFDDLRLHVVRPENNTGKNTDLVDLRFEVQVKTALQYAWGVATHDLTYKSDSASWPLERIAFQLKAMLEHAEVAIAMADRLSSAPSVSLENAKIRDLLSAMNQIKNIWLREQLPADNKRLAESVLALIKNCGYSVEELTELVENEKRRIGRLSNDISPYAFIVQAIANDHEDELRLALAEGRLHILVHSGMDLPQLFIVEHPGIIYI